MSLRSSLYRRAAVALLLSVVAGSGVQAAEIDLKSIQQPPLEQKKSKYGPYAGVFVGTTTGQDADMEIDYIDHTLRYDTLDDDGNIFFGLEVGYAWRTKYYLEFALEFEALFSTTEVDSLLSDSGNEKIGLSDTDLLSAKADMSYAAFMLNGVVTLDLKRLRPYIGSFWPRFRPYAGAGFGGAQIWYRNQTYQSVGDAVGTPTAAAATPFGIDEFVGAYQYFGGLEVTLTEKLSAYAEFRRLYFAKTNDLRSFSTDVFLGGFHLRY
jgi:opacity protein-like surface antigen